MSDKAARLPMTLASGLLAVLPALVITSCGHAASGDHNAATGAQPILRGVIVVLDTYSRDSNCTESITARESGINPLHTDYVEPGSTVVVSDAQGVVVGTGHLGTAPKPATGPCQLPFALTLTRRASTYAFTVNDVPQGETLLDSDLRPRGYGQIEITAATDPTAA